jgi:hypothetical protein
MNPINPPINHINVIHPMNPVNSMSPMNPISPSNPVNPISPMGPMNPLNLVRFGSIVEARWGDVLGVALMHTPTDTPTQAWFHFSYS